MYYIIQNNLFREEGLNNLISNLKRFNIPFEVVNLNKNDFINFNTNRKDVFCFGSLKMARLSKKYNWNPGALITKNHDYTVYSKYYKENLLNYDSKIMKISDIINWDNNDNFFIRPCLDSKIFTGKIFNQHIWEETQQHLLNDKRYNILITADTLIQVAKIKNIQQEIRCWV
jgi:hypothetical protein